MVSGFDGTGMPPESLSDVEPESHAGERPIDPTIANGQQAPGTAGDAGPFTAEPASSGEQLLATIAQTVERLAASAERYHARAEQREIVISHLHAEVDRLRHGERRSMLRPLLVEVCRLRNDLQRQADDLPGDFDAEQARLLLRSYADSIELALEDNGVAIFTPEKGDQFEPRLHRRVGGEPSTDPALVGRVAWVRRSGYLDTETSAPLAPAEVVLYVSASDGPTENSGPSARREDPDHGAREEPASATDERNEP
jgi:molecular chaperone GrpE